MEREGGDSAPTVSDGNWYDDAREELMFLGVNAAVVLLQMVATSCSVGVNDITWTGWDGYKFMMDAI